MFFEALQRTWLRKSTAVLLTEGLTWYVDNLVQIPGKKLLSFEFTKPY